MAKKTDYQEIEKKLMPKACSAWEVWGEAGRKKAFAFAEGYRHFLDQAKTEREAVAVGEKAARIRGFEELSSKKRIRAGDKLFRVHRGKALLLAKIGKTGLIQGANFCLAHVDAPHLDFKVKPLFEDEGLAFLKTHYYGGIKKYQWPTIPLAIHGVICLKSGEFREIVIGEDDNDPVFMITDLLPHLDRPGKPGSDVKAREVEGEHLNLLVGSIPVKDAKVKEKVKLSVLAGLNRRYGITEDDFASAELQAVPSAKARDAGFDRSLVAAYGQDDRICAYATIHAFFDSPLVGNTQICAWVDREEIGSVGNTSAVSPFIDNFISELLELGGIGGSLRAVNQVFSASKALSADVTAAVDPDYKDVFDLKNVNRLGYGVAIERYHGHGGKYHTSEASAEFISELRRIFSRDKDIVCQLGGGLGKIDLGGGGTISMFLANRDMEVADVGPAVLNMHAPLELSSKADLYCAYLAYKAFLAHR